MSPTDPHGFPPEFVTTHRHDVYDAISPTGALAGAARGLSVLITGAGGGIGRAVANTFARAGANKVVLVDIVPEELDEVEQTIKNDTASAGSKVLKIVADVTKPEDVQRIFEEAGEVDILINNAAIMVKWLPIVESDPEQWRKAWEVNVFGTYLTTRQFLQSISKSPRTRPATVINTSSLGSTRTALGASAYQSSKSSVNRFTEFVHYEHPEVRVFAYHPGAILTKLSLGMPESMHYRLRESPEKAGGFTLWLATQPEADFLRGRYSSSAWDVNELVARKDEILKKNLLFTVVAGQESER